MTQVGHVNKAYESTPRTFADSTERWASSGHSQKPMGWVGGGAGPQKAADINTEPEDSSTPDIAVPEVGDSFLQKLINPPWSCLPCLYCFFLLMYALSLHPHIYANSEHPR